MLWLIVILLLAFICAHSCECMFVMIPGMNLEADLLSHLPKFWAAATAVVQAAPFNISTSSTHAQISCPELRYGHILLKCKNCICPVCPTRGCFNSDTPQHGIMLKQSAKVKVDIYCQNKLGVCGEGGMELNSLVWITDKTISVSLCQESLIENTP